MVFRSPRATETYCRDETDPMALSGVSHFVADYKIGEVENGCSGKDGLGRQEGTWVQIRRVM